MLWYIIVGYLSLCYFCSICFACWNWYNMQHEDEVKECFEHYQKQLSPQAYKVSLILGNVFLVAAAPLTVPYIVHAIFFGPEACEARAEIAQLDASLRSHRELLLDPIHRYNLPDGLWDFFEENSQGLLALGYESLGDFTMKGEPVVIHSRLMVNPEKTTFAELISVSGAFGFELNSFLDDGTVVCSFGGNRLSMNENLESLNEMESHIIENWPHDDADQIAAKHQMLLAESSSRTWQAVRKMSDENWRDYFHYHNRIYSQKMFELGFKDEGPKSCEFPAETSVEEFVTSLVEGGLIDEGKLEDSKS